MQMQLRSSAEEEAGFVCLEGAPTMSEIGGKLCFRSRKAVKVRLQHDGSSMIEFGRPSNF